MILPCNGPYMNHRESNIAVSAESTVTAKYVVET